MAGGSWGPFTASHNGVASGHLVFDGGLLASIRAESDSTVLITGGSVSQNLLALNTSVITIVGEGFNFPLGDIQPIQGTLTGTLSDGTPISMPFGRASTAVIRLVPEPTTGLLLGLGLLGLVVGRRV